MPSATTLQIDATTTQQEILLEAGTNELEVLLLHVSGSSYGVNVAKVREVLDTTEGLARLPISHPAVDGVFRLRDQVIPLVNLRKYLGFDESNESSTNCAVATEFSDVHVAFRVDHVDRIYRIAWD